MARVIPLLLTRALGTISPKSITRLGQIGRRGMLPIPLGRMLGLGELRRITVGLGIDRVAWVEPPALVRVLLVRHWLWVVRVRAAQVEIGRASCRERVSSPV